MPHRHSIQGAAKQRGFTLVEVAIVLVIMGFLLGGLLGPLSIQMEESRRKATLGNIDQAHEALIGFALSTGRLPCPDTDNDGIEDPAGGAGGCNAVRGELPNVTLGLADGDAWGQSMLYLVTGEFADATDGTSLGCGPATPGVSFELCAVGDITILDQAAGGNIVASNIPAAIISQGKNWAGPASTDETENTDNDRTLVSMGYTATFDDLVRWTSPSILRARMASAGILP